MIPLLLLLLGCNSNQTPADPGTPGGSKPTLTCQGIGTAPAKSSVLDTASATYLGRGAGDAANAVDLALDCGLLVGGQFSGNDFGTAPTVLLGGTSGVVLRLDSLGRKVLAVTRLGGGVSDLETRRSDGSVAVGGDFGLALLAPDLKTVLWSVTDQGAASRVAVAADGTAAALFGKTVRVYDVAGNLLGSVSLGDSAVNDVAVDGSSKKVFVTGFAQRDGGACTKLQVAWVRAYDYAGNPAWKAYDWTHAQAAAANSSCADTRGIRVSMGRDGKLYFTGESAGGNSIYRYSPQDLRVGAPNVKGDKYTDPYNTASNHVTYYARMDPATGANMAGQFLLSRLDSGKGNTIRPLAITADEAGRVYVGGVSAYQIENRSGLVLDGQTLPAYAGDDAWVLIVSPDLKTRLLWAVWNAGGKGEVRGLAAGGGVAALSARVNAGPMHLNNAVQSDAPAGGGPGLVSVWPGWK